MRDIIVWELRRRRTAIIWWTVASVGLIAMLLLIYPSIHSQAEQLNKVLNQLPSSLKELKTGGTTVDITSPVGYLHSQLFYITLPLLFIILAITRGSGLIGKEEQDHTLELLLARPISRGKVLAAKALSGCVEMVIVSGFSTLAIVIFSKIVKLDIGFSDVVITSIYTALFSLSFGAIAFAIVALGRLTKRSSSAIAVFIAFGGYIIASLSGLSHYMVNIAKITPYHYFQPDQLLVGNYATGLNVYLIGVFVLCAVVSLLGFRLRDID
jgi:ABC-2 type transport system permease protein